MSSFQISLRLLKLACYVLNKEVHIRNLMAHSTRHKCNKIKIKLVSALCYPSPWKNVGDKKTLNWSYEMNILDFINRNESYLLLILQIFRKSLKTLYRMQNFSDWRCRFYRSSGDTRIFKRNPKALHVIDISENNMVELVRDIRSTEGYRW